MRSLASNKDPVSRFRNSGALTTIALTILILYFIFKTLYFALNIGFGISPDETTWFGRCLVFSKYFLLPTDSPESYEYGLVTHIPYLYFWLMGKVLQLNVFAISDLLFLRFANICIGLATLWFSWKTISILTEKTTTRLLFIVFCTNTLMLTFLNSFVSHDNLVNFFAVASIYFLLAYFQSRSFPHLLLCAVLLLAGCLTKLSFLPLAVLVFVVLVVKERKDFGNLFGELKSGFLLSNIRSSVLMVLCFFLLILNLDLYLGNMAKYRTLSPSPVAVVGLESAMQYRIFARGHIVNQFKRGKLSLTDSRRMAAMYIKHEGDRNGTFLLLDRASEEKQVNNYYRIDRFRYAFPWLDIALSKTFGIMGHKSMEKTGAGLIPYLLILLFAAILMVRRFRPSDMHGNVALLLIIVVAYALVIMQFVNYRSYDWSGVIVLALQGRYLFPVIYAGYALLAYYLSSFKSPRLNVLVATIVAAVFIAGEFPWFLSHVTADWYFAG